MCFDVFPVYDVFPVKALARLGHLNILALPGSDAEFI